MTTAEHFQHPWFITPSGVAATRARLENVQAHADKCAENLDSRPAKDFFGQPIAQLEMRDGVGIVPMKGHIMHNAQPMYKLFGFIDHKDVMDDIDAALTAGAKAIVLDINSPGGSAAGCAECANYVAQVAQETPVFAFTDDIMASAAYYPAAGATQIAVTQSAMVGSVGTIIEFPNLSAVWESMGVEWHQFTSGELKGAGSENLPVPDSHKDYFQSIVDQLAGEFQGHVMTYRPQVDSALLEGQAVMGTTAVNGGLADMVVSGLGEVLTLL
jgi:ClpP class serine protease